MATKSTKTHGKKKQRLQMKVRDLKQRKGPKVGPAFARKSVPAGHKLTMRSDAGSKEAAY
jgi:hypothetical protein